MEDLQDLISQVVRLYPPGSIPMNTILAAGGVRVIEAAFKFNSFAMVESGGGAMQFTHGHLVAADDHKTIILNATIEERRIMLTVLGTSAEADDAIDAICETIFGEEGPLADPLVVAAETSCSACLDFDWNELYGSGFTRFLNTSLIAGCTTEGVEPRILHIEMTFGLKYTTPTRLEEHAIGLSAKNFTIGPVPKVPLSERRYQIASPTRSEDHLRIVEELEKSVKEGAKK